MKKRRHNRLRHNNVEKFSWVFLSIMTIIFIFPMFMTFMVSISSEESILRNGYQLIPEAFSLEAYKLLLTHYGTALGRAMVLTLGTGIAQPILSIFLTMCLAYPMSQPDFFGKNFWRIYLAVTMLFSGGMIPQYILRTRYLGLRDNIWVYLVPGIGAWSVFLFRTFFLSIDKELVESAKIDGGSKLQILLRIMLPLTKPLVAMNFFGSFLGRWNDIGTSLLYVTNRKLYTVQYLLQEMLRSSDTAKALIKAGLSPGMEVLNVPVESTRYALAVIGALPVFFLFPFLQKYYAKGVVIGSTKG